MLEYSEVVSKLKKRALDFHYVLREYGVYTRELSETEFLRRTDNATERTAKNIDPFHISELDPRLDSYLESQGWILYPVTTGDQTGRFVLMPLKAVDAVKDYLLVAYPEIHPNYDPRSDWLYTGVPVSKLPADIWEQ